MAVIQQLAVLKRYINCSNNNRGSQTTNDVKIPTKCYLFCLKKKLPPRSLMLRSAGALFASASSPLRVLQRARESCWLSVSCLWKSAKREPALCQKAWGFKAKLGAAEPQFGGTFPLGGGTCRSMCLAILIRRLAGGSTHSPLAEEFVGVAKFSNLGAVLQPPHRHTPKEGTCKGVTPSTCPERTRCRNTTARGHWGKAVRLTAAQA